MSGSLLKQNSPNFNQIYFQQEVASYWIMEKKCYFWRYHIFEIYLEMGENFFCEFSGKKFNFMAVTQVGIVRTAGSNTYTHPYHVLLTIVNI